MANFHKLSLEKSFSVLNSSVEGLSNFEASKRQDEFGLNEFVKEKKQSKIKKYFSHFKDLMIIILMISAAISIAISLFERAYGDLVDAFIIIGVVILNATLGYVQEAKAENSLEKLKNFSQAEILAMREGSLLKIKTQLLTKGDIIFLEAGDIVPADARLIESANLMVDESALTGESQDVLKNHNEILGELTPLAEQKNMLFKGTTITNGRGSALVCEIGSSTQMGKIATAVANAKKQMTPLEENLAQVGKVISIAVVLVAALTFLLERLLHPSQKIAEQFLIAVALCVAAIPESLPAVITIIMSFGVWVLAKQNVIVKKLQAVETLGSCEVICSDKTGTITQNKMTVTEMFFGNKFFKVETLGQEDKFENLLKAAVLCNDTKSNQNGLIGDSTETALVSFFEKFGHKKQDLDKKFKRVDEISFNSQRKLMTTLNKDKSKFTLFSKGAISSVLRICSHIEIDGEVVPLDKELIKQINAANREFGSKALRVLAFCYKPLTEGELENKEAWENQMIFVGLIGMIDPPREEVFAAIEKCKKAGIRAVMITGDQSLTALAIAKQVGIASSENEILTGVEIDRLDDEEFLRKLEKINVFARVSPENKVRIVQGFKKLGKITAMTGDGVNDAPSLKQASIGVGMGITGTEITKEVADIVIADDNFATIVVAVEQGRKIFANIQKTIRFLFSANLAEIIAIFVANIIFPQFIFLLPMQILFVNLITDTLPSIALSFETSEKDIMQPQKRQTIFSKFNTLSIILGGLIQGGLVLLVFFIGTRLAPANNMVASTMAFVCLNLIQLFYIFSTKFNSALVMNNPFKNKMQNLAFLAGIALLLLVVLSPVRTVMKFALLSPMQWLVAGALAFAIVPLAEIVKFILNKTLSSRKN